MAWFHKTLLDMQKAIEKEDWAEVKRLLQQHNRFLDKGAPEVEHEISDIGHSITQYGEDMNQISIMLKSASAGKGGKNEMLGKVKSAITQAYFFEKTLQHLVKEGKFLE